MIKEMNLRKEVAVLAMELHDSIENDPRVIALKKAEERMEQDHEVMRLGYFFELAQTEYNAVLKIFDTNSIEALNAQKKLYKAKKVLDENTLVSEYLLCFQTVRKMYDIIQLELFSPFVTHNHCTGSD
jgi:hypothetical protein